MWLIHALHAVLFLFQLHIVVIYNTNNILQYFSFFQHHLTLYNYNLYTKANMNKDDLGWFQSDSLSETDCSTKMRARALLGL